MRCKFPSCKKKLSLVESSMACRCKLHFCAKHRLPSTHQCSIDYQSLQKKQLTNQLQDAKFQQVDAI